MTATVLVNGPSTSVQAPRARALFGDDARIVYKEHGRIGSAPAIASALFGDGWTYCMDLGFPAAPMAAAARRLRPRMRLAFEIGDPMLELLRPQDRSRAEVAIAHQFDRYLPAEADALVFRGSYLEEYFRRIATRPLPPSCWIPDGADTSTFRPMRGAPEVAALRQRWGLGGRFVVGIVGSIHHNPRLNLFYGWELAEALAKLPENVIGVVVGDGTGRAVLEATCRRLGVSHRMRMVGRVPHAEIPSWMNVFDLGLSTQTNDPVGWGRTTAKLPEYLACGLPVLCSDVGEAHRWLSGSGQTLAYDGLRDDAYPERLAAKIARLVGDEAELARLGRINRKIACEEFDYAILRTKLAGFLSGVDGAREIEGWMARVYG